MNLLSDTDFSLWRGSSPTVREGCDLAKPFLTVGLLPRLLQLVSFQRLTLELGINFAA